MKKLLVAMVILFSLLEGLTAQPLKILSAGATERVWQGGKAIRRGERTGGVDYTITLGGQIFNSIVFDSIYIGNFGMKFYSCYNIRFDTLHCPPSIYVSFSTPCPGGVTTRKIEGEGLIVYEDKGVKYKLPIKQFVHPKGIVGYKHC